MTNTLIDTMWRRLKAKIAEVKAQADHGRGTGTGPGVAQPAKFNATTSWAVFRHQFKTVAEHNYWMCQEKFAYLIITLQGQTTSMLHRVLKGTTNEETLEALEESFGDQHLAAAYCSQLKTKDPGCRGILARICHSH
jgi:hypothetical protein